MTTTYTLKRQLQIRAHMLRTLSSSRPWFTNRYTLSFDAEPVDSVSIYRKGTDDMCLFGLHPDDPFMATGIGEDEAYNIISKFLALMAEEKAKLN